MTIILQKGEKTLRLKSALVPVSEIGGAKVKTILENMKTVLRKEPDGIALAAPQIGELRRLFVISEKVTAYVKHKKNEHFVYINPKIIKSSSKKIVFDEGCLSVKNMYGKIKRAEKVTVEAYDEHGKKFVRGGSGLMAEIFQHEIDHLDGVLFTDTAVDLRKIETTKTNGKYP